MVTRTSISRLDLFRASLGELASTRLLTRLALALLLATGVLHLFMSLYPFPLSGGNDAFYHLGWIEGFVRLRHSGLIYPRWLPDSFGGFGATSFYYYPPLTYFLADAISGAIPGAGPTELYHLLQLFATLVSAVAMYHYLRFLAATRLASLLGALLFALGPMHLWDIFERDALAEQMAFLWLPMILLAIEYAKVPDTVLKLRSVVLSTISWAGLVLTDVPITVAMMLLVPLYAVSSTRADWRSLAPPLAGALLAVLCAAFYLVPAYLLRDLMPTQHLFDFLSSRNPWAFVLRDDVSSQTIKNGLHVIVTTIVLLSGALLWTLLAERFWLSAVQCAWLWLCVVSLVLQLPVTSQLWDIFTPLQLLQFSWRFCVILTAFLAICATYAFHPVRARTGRVVARLVLLVYCGFTFTLYARYALIVLTYPPPPPMLTEARIAPPEHVPIMAGVTIPDSLRSFVTKHRTDHLIVPDDSSKQVTFQIITETPRRLEFRTTAMRATDVRLHQFYWPYWKLMIDGKELPAYYDSLGLMHARLPAGEHRCALRLEESEGEPIGRWLSLAGCSVLSLLLVVGAVESLKRKGPAMADPFVVLNSDIRPVRAARKRALQPPAKRRSSL